jgi:hypothetical protein
MEEYDAATSKDLVLLARRAASGSTGRNTLMQKNGSNK